MTDIKKIVKEKYSRIALQPSGGVSSCSCCGGEVDYTSFSENYESLEGYFKDADLGLGCGLPVQFSGIKAGDTVVDLGSGAGNDCFVSRAVCGAQGQVIGVDFSEAMIEKARKNAQKLKLENVSFVLGEIEALPVEDQVADVVISNCVLNLVPDKQKAFKEIFRVLKPQGRFSISDVVLKGDLPLSLKNEVELYAGCVAGAIQMDEYLQIIKESGFNEIEIHKLRPIEIPEDVLKTFLDAEQTEAFNKSNIGIFSLSVSAKRV